MIYLYIKIVTNILVAIYISDTTEPEPAQKEIGVLGKNGTWSQKFSGGGGIPLNDGRAEIVLYV
jgi:hypothetical protein